MSKQRLKNPTTLRVLNLGSTTVAAFEATAVVHKRVSLFPYQQLWSAKPLSLYGGIAGVLSILASIMIQPVQRWYLRRQQKYFRQLVNAYWSEHYRPDMLDDLFKCAHRNFYILESASDLAELILILRHCQDLKRVAKFLIRNPDFLAFALQDAVVAKRLRNDAAMHQKILNAAVDSAEVNEVLRHADWVDKSIIPAVQRSVFLPSSMRSPLTWDLLYFLSINTGFMIGGLLTAVFFPTIEMVCIGANVGAAISLVFTIGYDRLAPWLRKKLRNSWLDIKENWERPRHPLLEAKVDMPLIARLNLGVAAGAALGASLATISTSTWPLVVCAYSGAALFGAAAMASPLIFQLLRMAYRQFAGAPEYKPYVRQPKGRRRFCESHFDVPWYFRLFAGVQVGTIFGPVGAVVGMFIGWSSPFVFALIRKLSGQLSQQVLATKPIEKGSDTPWYFNALAGMGTGMFLTKFALALFPAIVPLHATLWIPVACAGLGVGESWLSNWLPELGRLLGLTSTSSVKEQPDETVSMNLSGSLRMFAGGFTGQLLGASVFSIATALGISLAPSVVPIIAGVGALVGLLVPSPSASRSFTYAELPVHKVAVKRQADVTQLQRRQYAHTHAPKATLSSKRGRGFNLRFWQQEPTAPILAQTQRSVYSLSCPPVA